MTTALIPIHDPVAIQTALETFKQRLNRQWYPDLVDNLKRAVEFKTTTVYKLVSRGEIGAYLVADYGFVEHDAVKILGVVTTKQSQPARRGYDAVVRLANIVMDMGLAQVALKINANAEQFFKRLVGVGFRVVEQHRADLTLNIRLHYRDPSVESIIAV